MLHFLEIVGKTLHQQKKLSLALCDTSLWYFGNKREISLSYAFNSKIIPDLFLSLVSLMPFILLLCKHSYAYFIYVASKSHV